MTILDYETIETAVGDHFRRSDNLDIHADQFFPVTLLDLLFHYSERHMGMDTDASNRLVHRNFHGHDFDRWIDNMVANSRLSLRDEDGNLETVQLIDIDSMTIADDDSVTVTLPDETRYALIDSVGNQVHVDSVDNLRLHIDLTRMFDHGPVDSDSEPYMGFGAIAHIVRVVCEKSGIEVAKVNQQDLSSRIFNHFKNEMLPLIPSLWNDMEHIQHYALPHIS